jgi:hypothetical protein
VVLAGGIVSAAVAAGLGDCVDDGGYLEEVEAGGGRFLDNDAWHGPVHIRLFHSTGTVERELMGKLRLPRQFLIDLAALTGLMLNLDVTISPIAMGKWVIEVRGAEKHGLPLAQFYTGREDVAKAFLAGLLAGAKLEERRCAFRPRKEGGRGRGRRTVRVAVVEGRGLRLCRPGFGLQPEYGWATRGLAQDAQNGSGRLGANLAGGRMRWRK